MAGQTTQSVTDGLPSSGSADGHYTACMSSWESSDGDLVGQPADHVGQSALEGILARGYTFELVSFAASPYFRQGVGRANRSRGQRL